MKEAKKYIGCKIIKATPMSQKSFLREFRGEEVSNIPLDKPGYAVEYPDGYISWSPKDTFDVAYREITKSELDLLK